MYQTTALDNWANLILEISQELSPIEQSGFRFLHFQISYTSRGNLREQRRQMGISMTRILTERLIIRRFQESDLADYLTYQSHPTVREFMTGEPMDEQKAKSFLRQQSLLSDDDRDVYHAWAVVLKEIDRVIGDVGLYLPSGWDRVGDLGFQFHPDYHGRGYATEAANSLVRYMFTQWNLDRITSHCNTGNVSSYRLMERLGLSPNKNSGAPGCLAYELTRDSWLAAHTLGG